ncbi:MAG: serine hydrolase [Patescibacteria group bacterium]|nr:serine hydrolase [Patescibacteria group bacterium]MDD4610485.1 serine hydrolase [Patescibacteria group bacterium]
MIFNKKYFYIIFLLASVNTLAIFAVIQGEKIGQKFNLPPVFASTLNNNENGKVLGIIEASDLKSAGETEGAPGNILSENPITPEKEYPYLKNDAINFVLDAKNGVVINEKGDLLFDKDADYLAPIASITKLMTALVFLDYNPGWDTVYKMKKEDRREGGRIYLFTGDEVTVKDLFYLSLVASDNTATIGLVNSTGLSEEEFVQKMNLKAIELGLTRTSFVDPVGLSDSNNSCALEVAELAKAALEKEEIQKATLTKNYSFLTLGGRRKVVSSTDYLLEDLPYDGIKILGGKTGATEAAGNCFVGKFTDNAGNEIISVVLGALNYQARFEETKKMIKWVYDSYAWAEQIN